MKLIFINHIVVHDTTLINSVLPNLFHEWLYIQIKKFPNVWDVFFYDLLAFFIT